MATTDPITGGTIVDQSDVATPGFHLGRLLTEIRTQMYPRFPSEAARDAAYTAAGVTLVDGMRCFITNTKTECVRSNGAWTLWDTVWQTYNPSISTANFANFPEIVYGNGIRTGQYKRAGRSAELVVSWLVGTTTNYTGSGAGVIRFGYPPNLQPADNNYPGNYGRAAGTAYAGTSASPNPDRMFYVLHEYQSNSALRRMFLVDGLQQSVQGGNGAINIEAAGRFCSFTTSYAIT